MININAPENETPVNPAPKETPRVVAPPPLFFAVALTAGLILHEVYPHPLLPQPMASNIIGGFLMILGLALSLSVILHFQKAGTPVSPLRPSRRLVISGPYRFSRNPDYLGQTLLYIGAALALNDFWVLLAAVPALLLVRYGVIAGEERYLENLFGENYRRYRQRVRRWF